MLENTKGFFKRARSKTILFFREFQDFINNTKEKFKNLYQTNYNTGLHHLEHGNLWDASLRFKIIKKFWPDKLEAQYQYAVCLILQNMNEDAKVVLNEILKKDQKYSEAKVLLKDLEGGKTQKMVEEYKAKFNKDNEKKTKTK